MNWQDIFENTVVKNKIPELTSDKTVFYIRHTLKKTGEENLEGIKRIKWIFYYFEGMK